MSTIMKFESLASENSKPAFNLVSGNALTKIDSLQWRVDQIIPMTGIGVIYGASGEGKSFYAIDLGMSIARGINWFGKITTISPVVYLSLEAEHGFKVRIAGYCNHAKIETPENFHAVFDPFRLDNTNTVEELIRICPRNSVIFIDTISRALPTADENSSKDMGIAIDNAIKISKSLNSLVIFIGHTGKDSSRGWRGWSGLNAAVDFSIEVSEDDTNTKQFRVTKLKDGQDGFRHTFSLKPINFQINSSDQISTTCVIDPGIEIKKKSEDNVIMTTLYSTIAANKESFTNDNMISIEKSKWKSSFIQMHGGENYATAEKRFYRAYKSIKDHFEEDTPRKGLITIKSNDIIEKIREWSKRNSNCKET